MLKRLEIQALRADLRAVEHLLLDRTAENDPLGFMQLRDRQTLLQEKLDEAHVREQHHAAIALFFAGGPVVGSRGIEATFAGKAVGIFQELVTKQFALEEIGEMGRRGPVAMQPNSDLLVTNVVRGSVGLILEEADQNDAIADTQLKVVVDHVVETIAAAAAPEADAFEQALEGMEPRFLASLSEFFQVLDDKSALLRLVEDEREVEFDGAAIKRGKDRAGASQIVDHGEETVTGRVFLLPAGRRFELRVDDEAELVTGWVAREFARRDLEGLIAAGNAVGERWRVRVKTRTVTRPSGPPKITYTLVGMIERVG